MELIRKNVKGITREFINDDNDYWLVIDGREGAGKSNLALIGCYENNKHFSINNIAFTGLDFLKKIRKANKGDSILWDESAEGAYSKESINRLNIIISKASMFIRGKNLFVILVLPSFFVLDKYLRILRLGMLWRVVNKGHMVAYGKKGKTLMKLVIDGSKYFDYSVVKPNFADTFPKFDEINANTKAIYSEYLKLKKTFMNDYLDEAISSLEDKIENSSLCEVCDTSNGYLTKRGWICRKCGHTTSLKKIEEKREQNLKIKKLKELKDKKEAISRNTK